MVQIRVIKQHLSGFLVGQETEEVVRCFCQADLINWKKRQGCTYKVGSAVYKVVSVGRYIEKV